MKTVKEKLVKLLKNIRINCTEGVCNCDECEFRFVGSGLCCENLIADYLVKHGVTIQECGMDCKNCWKTKLVNPVQEWVSVDERLPEDGTPVAVILTPTYASDYWGYAIARYIDTSNGERHWYADHHGYLEWDKYSDGSGGCSLYKVTHWMPLPAAPPKGVK